MDADLFAAAIEYELLTQAIYQTILLEEGERNIEVKHNLPVAGRSGVEHQIDVFWRFKRAGVTHTVLVECKNYSSAITLEKVRNLFAVAHDIGNCQAIMVTKTGFQGGAVRFAKHYGIHLKLLRKPIGDDWKGRIKDIIVRMRARIPVSTEDRPITVNMYFNPSSTEQEERLNRLSSAGLLQIPNGADIRFLDSSAVPATDEMRWWLPKQLNVLDKDPGGPYEQSIPLEDKYLLVSMGKGHEELVKVGGLIVRYYVEQFDMPELVMHGEETVRAILKDFCTGEIEHVLRKD